MGLKAPPAAKMPWGISFIEKQYIHIKKLKVINFETKVAELLEGCYLVSFVKLVSKTSIRHLVERSYILNSILDAVFKIP